jgi:hypothetical protein
MGVSGMVIIVVILNLKLTNLFGITNFIEIYKEIKKITGFLKIQGGSYSVFGSAKLIQRATSVNLTN